MTHPFSFQGYLTKYWQVLYAEYQRLTDTLGSPPFELMFSNSQTINEYVPSNGDEIIIYFWDKEHKNTLLIVEAALLPDEDLEEVQVMIFPQGNPYEEPFNSAMLIWREIKRTLQGTDNQGKQSATSITNIYVGGDVTGGNIISGNENEANINSTKAKKKRKS